MAELNSFSRYPQTIECIHGHMLHTYFPFDSKAFLIEKKIKEKPKKRALDSKASMNKGDELAKVRYIEASGQNAIYDVAESDCTL